MSFYAFVELINGEKVIILKPDGHIFGKQYASLISQYQFYVMEIDTDVNAIQWFEKLEKLTKGHIKKIDHATYIGDWEYSMDDYEKYINNWGKAPDVTEEKFKEILTEINSKWTPMEELIVSVEKVVQALPSLYTNEFFWYSPDDALSGFQGLLNTLRRLHEEGNDLVRIQIT